MFAKGSHYLRQIAVRKRKGLFLRGIAMYEVMTEPGVTVFVERKYLGSVVHYDPRGSRMDMQEAKAVARRLYDEGRRGEWVHFGTAGVVEGSSLHSY